MQAEIEHLVKEDLNAIGCYRLVEDAVTKCLYPAKKESKKKKNILDFVNKHQLFIHYCDIANIDPERLRKAILRKQGVEEL